MVSRLQAGGVIVAERDVLAGVHGQPVDIDQTGVGLRAAVQLRWISEEPPVQPFVVYRRLSSPERDLTESVNVRRRPGFTRVLFDAGLRVVVVSVRGSHVGATVEAHRVADPVRGDVSTMIGFAESTTADEALLVQADGIRSLIVTGITSSDFDVEFGAEDERVDVGQWSPIAVVALPSSSSGPTYDLEQVDVDVALQLPGDPRVEDPVAAAVRRVRDGRDRMGWPATAGATPAPKWQPAPAEGLVGRLAELFELQPLDWASDVTPDDDLVDAGMSFGDAVLLSSLRNSDAMLATGFGLALRLQDGGEEVERHDYLIVGASADGPMDAIVYAPRFHARSAGPVGPSAQVRLPREPDADTGRSRAPTRLAWSDASAARFVGLGLDAAVFRSRPEVDTHLMVADDGSPRTTPLSRRSEADESAGPRQARSDPDVWVDDETPTLSDADTSATWHIATSDVFGVWSPWSEVSTTLPAAPSFDPHIRSLAVEADENENGRADLVATVVIDLDVSIVERWAELVLRLRVDPDSIGPQPSPADIEVRLDPVVGVSAPVGASEVVVEELDQPENWVRCTFVVPVDDVDFGERDELEAVAEAQGDWRLGATSRTSEWTEPRSFRTKNPVRPMLADPPPLPLPRFATSDDEAHVEIRIPRPGLPRIDHVTVWQCSETDLRRAAEEHVVLLDDAVADQTRSLDVRLAAVKSLVDLLGHQTPQALRRAFRTVAQADRDSEQTESAVGGLAVLDLPLTKGSREIQLLAVTARSITGSGSRFPTTSAGFDFVYAPAHTPMQVPVLEPVTAQDGDDENSLRLRATVPLGPDAFVPDRVEVFRTDPTRRPGGVPLRSGPPIGEIPLVWNTDDTHAVGEQVFALDSSWVPIRLSGVAHPPADPEPGRRVGLRLAASEPASPIRGRTDPPAPSIESVTVRSAPGDRRVAIQVATSIRPGAPGANGNEVRLGIGSSAGIRMVTVPESDWSDELPDEPVVTADGAAPEVHVRVEPLGGGRALLTLIYDDPGHLADRQVPITITDPRGRKTTTTAQLPGSPSADGGLRIVSALRATGLRRLDTVEFEVDAALGSDPLLSVVVEASAERSGVWSVTSGRRVVDDLPDRPGPTARHAVAIYRVADRPFPDLGRRDRGTIRIRAAWLPPRQSPWRSGDRTVTVRLFGSRLNVELAQVSSRLQSRQTIGDLFDP